MKWSNIIALIRKDLTVEWRQGYAVAGILLFAIAVVFILFKTFNEIGPQTWNILMWIVTLFAGINAIVKSFVQEKNDTYLYYYTLVHPLEYFLAKLIYNYFFLLLLIGIIVGAFTVFVGNPIKDFTLFAKGVLVGSIGLATVFTFVSSINGGASQNATMMSILALPLVLPIVLMLIKVTSVAMRLMQDSAIGQDLWMLAGISFLLLGVVLLLYPVVWRG